MRRCGGFPRFSSKRTISAAAPAAGPQKCCTAGSAISSNSISDWCANRWGELPVDSDPVQRRYDLPWIVLDPSGAEAAWDFKIERPIDRIHEEIAVFAEANPDWLDLSLGKK
jgi:hypothetical protein